MCKTNNQVPILGTWVHTPLSEKIKESCIPD